MKLASLAVSAAAMLLGHILFPGTDSMFLYPLLIGAAIISP